MTTTKFADLSPDEQAWLARAKRERRAGRAVVLAQVCIGCDGVVGGFLDQHVTIGGRKVKVCVCGTEPDFSGPEEFAARMGLGHLTGTPTYHGRGSIA